MFCETFVHLKHLKYRTIKNVHFLYGGSEVTRRSSGMCSCIFYFLVILKSIFRLLYSEYFYYHLQVYLFLHFTLGPDSISPDEHSVPVVLNQLVTSSMRNLSQNFKMPLKRLKLIKSAIVKLQCWIRFFSCSHFVILEQFECWKTITAKKVHKNTNIFCSSSLFWFSTENI